MKVLAHHDPWTLERELLERVDAVHPRGRTGRTLVLVPTRRLAEHVQRRLIERRPAWLGVEVLHFRALAREVLDRAGTEAPRVLSRRLREVVLRRRLDDAPDSPWSAYVALRPGAAASLLSSIDDLREAAVSPSELEACLGPSPAERAAGGIYASYCRTLDSLATGGIADEAALIGSALAHVPAWAAGLGAVLVHGLYELIGIHLELLRTLDRTAEVTLLVPASESAPATVYARDFALGQLLPPGQALPELDRPGPRAGALAALYDESAEPPPSATPALGFWHAQGSAAEVKLAVRLALAAICAGVPPREIAITARSLEPYVSALERELHATGLEWTSSARSPLRRHPLVHDAVLMLRAVNDDFPRRATAELLRSPRIRWSLLAGEDAEPFGERADRWSRKAGILGGLAEWTEGLERWAAEPRVRQDATDEERSEARREAASRREVCRRAGRALAGLLARFEPRRARSWSGHAARIEEQLARLFRESETEEGRRALEALGGLLVEMRDLDRLAGATPAVSFGEMVDWLEQAVDGSEIETHAEERGGIRVLDVMQLRGLTFRRVLLLGMNASRFPRPAREDPLLPDELRARLRGRGRTLPLRADRALEERQLLSLVVGAAAERIDVVWQRADESGRARTPSLAVRELGRLARGRPDLEPTVAGAGHFPSHPAHQLEALVAAPGLLTADEERLLGALRSSGPGEQLERWFPELGPGLSMLRATESFAPGRVEFDGRVGERARPPAVHTASGLEQLGRCPLQFFFHQVLRVRELEDEANAFDVEPRRLGLQIHDLLRRVFAALSAEGRLGAAGPAAVARAGELLGPCWDQAFGDRGRRLAARVPVLWDRVRELWLDALRRFLADDLERIADGEFTSFAFEQTVRGEVELGGSARLEVAGRLDRVLAGPGGSRIGDYKTSGKLAAKVDETEMLKAASLQVPLYWLLAGRSAAVEVLGVGPGFQDDDAPRARFEGFAEPQRLEGFLETLRTLGDLVARGRYPLRADSHCAWCDYALACRREHPPTLGRERAAEDSADFRLLARKNKSSKPTLDLVRGGRP